MKFRSDQERHLWEEWAAKFLEARLRASKGIASSEQFATDASDRADCLLTEWRLRQ